MGDRKPKEPLTFEGMKAWWTGRYAGRRTVEPAAIRPAAEMLATIGDKPWESCAVDELKETKMPDPIDLDELERACPQCGRSTCPFPAAYAATEGLPGFGEEQTPETEAAWVALGKAVVACGKRHDWRATALSLIAEVRRANETAIAAGNQCIAETARADRAEMAAATWREKYRTERASPMRVHTESQSFVESPALVAEVAELRAEVARLRPPPQFLAQDGTSTEQMAYAALLEARGHRVRVVRYLGSDLRADCSLCDLYLEHTPLPDRTELLLTEHEVPSCPNRRGSSPY